MRADPIEIFHGYIWKLTFNRAFGGIYYIIHIQVVWQIDTTRYPVEAGSRFTGNQQPRVVGNCCAQRPSALPNTKSGPDVSEWLDYCQLAFVRPWPNQATRRRGLVHCLPREITPTAEQYAMCIVYILLLPQ